MADKKAEIASLVHPEAEGFKEKVTPKSSDELMMFKCPEESGGCGGAHFRHAGYVKILLPFLMPNSEKKVGKEDISVMVCVKCKRSYVWVDSQMYDVTDKIDLKAWEKTEKEAHKATGPGGQC